MRISLKRRACSRVSAKGVTIPPTDCLIAAIALRRKLLLYVNDRNFDDIPGLKRYRP